MRWSRALLIPLLLAPTLAFATPTRFEFDTLRELFSDDFARVDGGGRSVISGDSTFEIDTPSYEEWKTDLGGLSRWWAYVDEEKGWYVEFRVRVERGGECEAGGTGVWIHDGTKLFHVTMSASSVGFTYPFQTPVRMDTTDDFHVYRVAASGDGHPQLFVDDVFVDEFIGPYSGGGSTVLMFGDLGGCLGSRSVWDYFEYDTAAYGRSDLDSDLDGFIDSEDTCAFVPNFDQNDRDRDRRGDACDVCPDDVNNDSDLDGLCDSEDRCPTDPTNADADGNGICDVDEACICIGFNCRRAPGCEPVNPPGPPEDPVPDDDGGGLDTLTPEGCSCGVSSRAEVSVLVIAVLLVLSAVRARATRSTQRGTRSRSHVR